MSSETTVHPNGGGNKQKRNRSRDRRHSKIKEQKKKNTEGFSSYKNVSFRDRPSSGRPGSPHRYFEDSYDVLFVDDISKVVDCPPSSSLSDPDVLSGEPELTSSSPTKASQPIDGNSAANPDPAHSKCGDQVVHRHLNGLCIVTAGNVLETMIQQNLADKEGADQEEIGISSIEYLVKVGQDSLSAKGKIRTKNKKQKRIVVAAGKDDGSADGNVSPNDPLCRITLSDGTYIQLNCCVLGTVIELNHRLDSKILGPSQGKEGTKKTANEQATFALDRDPSLVLKDPLLDGYLAVIIPSRGSFPPKGKGTEDKRI